MKKLLLILILPFCGCMPAEKGNIFGEITSQILEDFKAKNPYPKIRERKIHDSLYFIKNTIESNSIKAALLVANISTDSLYNLVLCCFEEVTKEQSRLNSIENIEKRKNKGGELYIDLQDKKAACWEDFCKKTGLSFIHLRHFFQNWGEEYRGNVLFSECFKSESDLNDFIKFRAIRAGLYKD